MISFDKGTSSSTTSLLVVRFGTEGSTIRQICLRTQASVITAIFCMPYWRSKDRYSWDIRVVTPGRRRVERGKYTSAYSI